MFKNIKAVLFFMGSLVSATSFASNVYEQVLICDGGAAVIDRNTLSPTYPQLVIRNPQIVNYLQSAGINVNKREEVILTGVNDQPVYQAHDFHGFKNLGSDSANDWVRREGEGIRVSFNRLISPSNSDCGRDVPLSDPSCQRRWVQVADWYFQSCQ